MSIVTYSDKFPLKWYASGVIIFNHDLTKTIIVKTPTGNIGFPKGGKENRERLHQTAYREVDEETGLKSYQYKHDDTLIGEKKGDPTKGNCTIYYFIAHVKKEIESIPLKCCMPNELSFVDWVPIDEAYNILCKRRKTILEEAHKYIIGRRDNNMLDKNIFTINNFYKNIKITNKYKNNIKNIEDIVNDNITNNSNDNFCIMNKYY
jgi:8-oxo-dGTP pyrophosphatase MutT (NUDIX family)